MVGVAVLAGSLLQRVTGMGFALVSAPFLVLIVGPSSGVILLHLCSLGTAGTILVLVRHDIDWHRALTLLGPACLGTVCGALIVRVTSVPVLQVAVGLLVVISLSIPVLVRSLRVEPRTRYVLTSGYFSGLMGSTAGLAGPALSVLAVITRWNPRSFAATMQPFFVLLAVFTIGTYLVTDPASMPALGLATWIVIVCACVVGIVVGDFAARRLPVHLAHVALVTIALLGGALTAVRGITDL